MTREVSASFLKDEDLARPSRQMRIPLGQVVKKRHSRYRRSVVKKTLDKSIEP